MLRETSSSLAQHEIEANLACEIDGQPLTIRSANRRIVVEVPNIKTGWRLLQLGPFQGLLLHRLHCLKHGLDQMRLSLELMLDGKPVATIGYRVGSPLWRLLGLPSLRLRLDLLLAFLLFRRRVR